MTSPDVSPPSPTPPDIQFLTRQGCSNTPILKSRLKKALADTGLDFMTISQDSLLSTDPRVGYSTPTILVNGADLFGQDEPTPPYATPS